MSDEKQVSIARHVYFYKIFFIKHQKMLENFIELSFDNLIDGYEKLNVFYGSYSYWIKEDEEDEYIKELLFEKQESLKERVLYNSLKAKVNTGGIKKLTFEELCQVNNEFYEVLKEILEVFEIFCHRLAPNDMLPNMTESHQEYDRTLAYVVYDSFYEGLYNLHAKIDDKLMNFNILEFRDLYQIIMVFFYGYSYYIQKNTIKKIKDEFNKLFIYYNDKTFLRAYFNLLQGKSTKPDLITLKEYRMNMFKSSLNIFEMINADLPKSNLMPKKQEKVLIDDTLI